ncbi:MULTISPECIES: Zn-ribbon domain-containing OB-fold protein [Pseudofrankia]|uniref:Zn-ribbon domain-containing OB-fold protein n=1 Tax=Pseudofrankia TaxID=2994363 RepID=UPI000234D834|nr:MULTISPECIES: OB-fold domain-containing protein [Pseudofrankia]OHV31869.1 DNA-binding protein [Pseudofrankia sp. EUN1h]
MTKSRPIDDGLFIQTDDGPRLVGSSCRSCGTTTFPRQQSCPKCTRVDMADSVLPRRGALWSFTVQGFRPKPPYAGPAEFVPYGVGYVELPGAVLVEAVLTENDPERLHIGDEMELVLRPLRRDEDGTEVLTFAFAPAR